MLRKIIKIDENACTGCGLCVTVCHEGAIGMENGKAKLLREDYCDGLGDCLPACPANAISFEMREAPAYDEEAVHRAQAQKKASLIHSEAPRLLLNAPHPSPLSSYRGFFGSKPFSQTNDFLTAHGEAPICWG